MKFCNSLFAFLSACLLLGMVSCKDIFGNQSEPDTTVPNTYPVISGEISVPVPSDPSFGWAPAAGSVNLGDLKARSGTSEPTLVAIGGSLTAGYRDGGLFREGQITSYPNLVARQMGLSNFKQPLFERESGNGTGRLVLDGKRGTLRWKEASNNLGYQADSSVDFKPYMGTSINNFAVPGLHLSNLGNSPDELLPDAVTYYQKNPKSYRGEQGQYLWNKPLSAMALYQRLVPSNSIGWDRINELKPDVGIVEAGLDVYISNNLSGGGNGLYDGQRWPHWELQMLDRLKETGTKYLYATIPDLTETPFFNGTLNGIPNKIKTMPEGAARPERYNDLFIKKFAKDYNHPLVDFYAVYKKVLAGQYISEDGFKIDPSFPNGNFFSADGLYPSAIGQAVLANEVIKVFNTSYGSQIPLIKIKDYARELGKN